MLKFVFRATAAVSLAASVAAAQSGALASSKCSASGTAVLSQDVCQQAYDVYQFMAPQLGISLSGGNATIGQGSVLGGLGHISVGIRGNVLNGVVPDLQNSGFAQSTTGAQRRVLPTKTTIVGLPTAD